MREAGAGTNNFSLAHHRRERMERLEKQVDKNSAKLFNPDKPITPSASDIEEPEDDSTSKIQDAKSIVQEYKKQTMDGTEGTDFTTSLDTYD